MAYAALQGNSHRLLYFHKVFLNFGFVTVSGYTQAVELACPSHGNAAGTCLNFSDFPDGMEGHHPYTGNFAKNHAYKTPIEHHSSLGISLFMNSNFLPFACLPYRHFSSTVPATIISRNLEADALAEGLENALEARRVEDAWTIFEQLNKLRCFPQRPVLNRLLNVLAYSGNTKWIKEAYALVLTVLHKKKWHLLSRDSLTQLSLSLARAQLPLEASNILRMMVEKNDFLSVSIWKTFMAHMVKSESGTYLACEILIEHCSLLQDAKHRRKKPAMKPDVMAFCIVLNACLAFGCFRKALEVLELMPQVGVKFDSTCFMIMAQIYEKNGCREELKKLKRKIGEDPSRIECQYRQYYSSLLICHLNFGDLDAASELVLGMLESTRLDLNKNAKDHHAREVGNGVCTKSHTLCKPSADQIVMENSPKQHKHPMVQIEPRNLKNSFVVEVPSHDCLFKYEKKMLSPNATVYAMLAKGYLQAGRSDELIQFLVRVDHDVGLASTENSACTQIIDGCIELGWLDYAYDMIDEMNAAGAAVCARLYSSLLKAYCKARRPMDVASVLKVVRKAGFKLDPSCYEALVEACEAEKDMRDAQDIIWEIRETKDSLLTNSNPTLKSSLPKSTFLNLKYLFLEEVKKSQQLTPCSYELNSVIQFFCKGHLMEDAEQAFKKLIKLGHQPTSQTFEHLINGYSVEGSYQKIARLWEDMKRMENDFAGIGATSIKFDKELHDTLVYNFLKGCYFDRSLEVITRMEQQNMFVDKWKYKQVFLKFHKDQMHRKPFAAQSEAQLKNIKHVLAFKQWAGI